MRVEGVHASRRRPPVARVVRQTHGRPLVVSRQDGVTVRRLVLVWHVLEFRMVMVIADCVALCCCHLHVVVMTETMDRVEIWTGRTGGHSSQCSIRCPPFPLESQADGLLTSCSDGGETEAAPVAAAAVLL